MPLFSIITICYNSERTLKRTLDSVLFQSFTDYEYIIVDGGSKDCTLTILEEYKSKFYGKLKIKSEPDKGIYDAFNKGIQRAIGKYLWIVNSDDFIEKDALLNLYVFLSQRDFMESIVVGGLRWVDETGKELYVKKIFEADIQNAYNKDWMIPHPSTIVPKSIYDKYGNYDVNFKTAGDIDWFHRIFPLVTFITIPLVLSNMTVGGVTYTNSFIEEYKEKKLFLTKKYGSKYCVVNGLLRWFYRKCRNIVMNKLLAKRIF